MVLSSDVFALQTSGVVQAIKSDCKEAWRAPAGTSSTLLPDFQGGLIVADATNTQTVRKRDGITGQTYPAIPYTGGQALVHTDGTLFLKPSPTTIAQGNNTISLFDPVSGNPKTSPTIPSGTYSFSNCEPASGSGSTSPWVGQAIIAGGGYLYVPYENESSSSRVSCDNTAASHAAYHMGVLRVGSNGSTTDIAIGDWTSDCVDSPTPYCGAHSVGNVGNLITNGDQGVLYSWSLASCRFAKRYLERLKAIVLILIGVGTVVYALWDGHGLPIRSRIDSLCWSSLADGLIGGIFLLGWAAALIAMGVQDIAIASNTKANG